MSAEPRSGSLEPPNQRLQLPGRLLSACRTSARAALRGSVAVAAPGDCCAAGTVPQSDGTCAVAGVPADGCGTGFVSDDQGGCAAVMPESPCGLGTMALPGETVCRAVAPCGVAPWGDIPVDLTTQYVDGSYGGSSDGSSSAPWTTIADGLSAAAPGAIVAVAAGSYPESLVLTGRPVRLWGRCPELVTIAAPTTALRVGAGADGSEIHTLAIQGGAIGIDNAGAADVVTDRVIISNTAAHAIRVRGDSHPTHDASLTVTGSLIEGGQRSAILAAGSDIRIEDTVVRHGADSIGTEGEGIRIEGFDFDGTPKLAEATIRRVVVERTYRLGILFAGASGVIEDTLVRDILPVDGVGRGLAFESHPGDQLLAPSEVVVRRSVVQGAHELGVLLSGSTVTLEQTVVRATLPSPASLQSAGLHVQPQAERRSHLTVRQSLIVDNGGVGLGAFSADLDIEGTIVRDTQSVDGAMEGIGLFVGVSARSGEPSVAAVSGCQVERNGSRGLWLAGSELALEGTVVTGSALSPSASDPNVGIDITSADAGGGEPALDLLGCRVSDNSDAGVRTESGLTRIEGSLIEGTTHALDRPGIGVWALMGGAVEIIGSVLANNHGAGVLLESSRAHIEGTVIRASEVSPNDDGPLGIRLDGAGAWGAPSHLTMVSSLIESVVGFGVRLSDSDALIEATVIRQVEARPDGTFGDGVAAMERLADTVVELRGCRVSRASRASLASFGASAILETNAFDCAPVHLNGEAWEGNAYSFTDHGGNSCGCDEKVAICKVLSSSLQPPGPLLGGDPAPESEPPDTFEEIGPTEP
jgi:hypothetical protein